MRGSPCLYRRPSGIYAVRIVVPMRLRGLVGRGEIHASTGRKDLGAAKIVALRIQLQWRDHFVTLNIELLTVASPLLQGGGTIGIQEAAGAIGMTTADLMGAMLNDGSPVLTYVQNLLGWQIADIHDIDREDGRYLLNDVEAKGINTSHTGFVRFHDSAATLSGLIANGNYNESVFRGSGTSALFLGYQLEIPLSRCVSPKSAIERIRARLAGYVPTQQLTLGSRTAMPAVPPLAGMYDPITAKHGHKRFSELFAIYKGDRDWNACEWRGLGSQRGGVKGSQSVA